MVKNSKQSPERRRKKTPPASKGKQPTIKKGRLGAKTARAPDNPATFFVHGRVLDFSKSPAAGLTVVAFDRDLAGENRLGDHATDLEGNYRIAYSAAQFRLSKSERGNADVFVRIYGANGGLLLQSTTVRNAPTDLLLDAQLPGTPFIVRGQVSLHDGTPAVGTEVRVYDRDLRSTKLMGKFTIGLSGRFEIAYTAEQFHRAEKGNADLLLKAFDLDDKELAATPVLFNAPPSAEMNLTISAEKRQSPSLFERIGTELLPLRENLKVEELEENKKHQDISFLSGETGFEKRDLSRFVLAHRLTQPELPAEFWFALLDNSFFQRAENQSLAQQLTAILSSLASRDAVNVGKTLARALNQNEIAVVFREKVAAWTEAFSKYLARRLVSESDKPTFIKSALNDAGIEGAEKQEQFARLFNQHKALTPEMLGALEKDKLFKPVEIADLRTSFRLAELSGGDFSVVAVLKEEFAIRQPENIRTLAKRSERDWVDLIKAKHAAGEIELPTEFVKLDGQTKNAAERYGQALERRFREAFPTTAFAGGLTRALQNGGAHGLKRAQDLEGFLADHEQFELLRTPVDDFFKSNVDAKFRALANDEGFRLEVKAVQRVFKLAPTFEATDVLLADNLHSAQKIYRMGESEFVRAYADRPGFTTESARLAWNRAADTHAAALTLVADLKSHEVGPQASSNDPAALSNFPNWDNLFKSGDLCECESCRSVLGPAAYFADLLMFLKDRKSTVVGGTASYSAKDVLFKRRRDLGYLELNCDNAMTQLPYIDVVCEVLEDAVAAGASDIEFPGFVAIPPIVVSATLSRIKTFLNLSIGDADISLSQVDPADPYRWVMHTDNVTFLLKKKGPPSSNFFAEILRNTKASAAELRAYPQYVNTKAYDKLRTAQYPLTLPFDLYAEEVRAAFQKINLKRWELMRTMRGPATPNNPTDSDIAAEYFGISISAKTTDPSEKSIILSADPTIAGQTIFWGEVTVQDDLKNVKVFLRKSALEYNELLALIDLKFINPDGDIVIQHLDASCDTDRKIIQHLDLAKLDRIHRFLRLWRKLPGWKMWELDLVIEHPQIGRGGIDESFLVNLFYFCEVKNKLGGKSTIEQVCALFGNLNTRTSFTKLHEKRADALYQNLFLNRRLIHPVDPSFAVGLVTTPTPTTAKLATHLPSVFAALGIGETDLDLLIGLKKFSSGIAYISDDLLTLANLSFLWRHAWLPKQLKFNATEWRTILQLAPEPVPSFVTLADARNFLETRYHIKAASFAQAEVDATLLKISRRDMSDLACPKAALEFLQEIEQLKATGFTPDELSWLLVADRSAKAAMKEADAARFLAGLHKDLRAIRSEYDSSSPQYVSLASPADVDNLTSLLTSLLQKLNRNEIEANVFLKTLSGSVRLEARVQDLPAGFQTLAPITAANIPITYEQGKLLRFNGVMTGAQKITLLSNALPAAVIENPFYVSAIDNLYQQSLAVTDNYVTAEIAIAMVGGVTLPPDRPSLPVYYNTATQKLRFIGVMTNAERQALRDAGNSADAIDELFYQPRMAVKYFEPIFTAPLRSLPAAVDFKSQLPADLAAKISYDVEQRVLRYTGIMSAGEFSAIDALVTANVQHDNIAYHSAVASLKDQPRTIAVPDERIWLADGDLDVSQPVNDTLAKRLANTVRKALNYLSRTLSDNAVVQQSAAQLGLTEALTRRLLTSFAIVPVAPKATLMAHLTGNFAIDSTTFNSWYWVNRIAAILKKWKITLLELHKIDTLKGKAKLFDLSKLPLDVSGSIDSLEKVLRIGKLFKVRDSLPESEITLLEVLDKLDIGTYAAVAATSNPAVSEKHLFAIDVHAINEAWSVVDIEALVDTLDLTYPTDYLFADSWERLRRAFVFLESLNAGANTVKTLAAVSMTDAQAKTIKELMRSKFGTETWLALSTEIQDALRERKRDALAAYLLSQPKPIDAPTGKWENTNDLYAYYLLDVEMCSCQLTSRLVQASGSVQLFVQRCFMGLEPEVVVTADGGGDSAWRWWKWMRKYQVWVANRKVFLWPENWIEPELKKDRSPFFKDLENELLQNEITQDTVEIAFSSYLEKLDGVAQLEITGFFQEDNGANSIVHVFGRTAGAEPHLYYYRRYDYRQWSPWEKVELDIQGDYLIPAVIGGRLFLFWPIFTEVPDDAGNNKMKIPQPGQKIFAPDQTQKKLKLQMAVSGYRQGKWTPKRVSKDFAESKSYAVENLRRNYQFSVIDRSNVDGRIVIQYDGLTVDTAAIEASLAAAQAVAKSNFDSADADVDSAIVADGVAYAAAHSAAEASKNVGGYVTLAEDLAAFIDNDSDPINHRGIDKVNHAQTAVNAVADIDSVDPNSLAASFGLDAGFVGDAADFKRLVNWTLGQCVAANDPNNPNSAKAARWAKDRAHTALDLAKALLKTAQAVRDDIASEARTVARDLRAAKTKLSAALAAKEALSYRPQHPNASDFIAAAVADAKNAGLRGAFDISGGTGAPEKTDSLGPFAAATRPEQGAVGDVTAFLKWIELSSHDSAKNDFSLDNYFSPTSIQPTAVLGKTPDVFKMSPAWHLSHRDKLCVKEDPSFNRVGTFLPFFFNDKTRTFFVQPSLLIENQGYGAYPELEKFLGGFDIFDQRGIRSAYLLTQKFHFKNFYHPFVSDFARVLNNPLKGVPALMSRDTQLTNSKFNFELEYDPKPAVVKLPPEYNSVADCYPRELVDFSPDGAYSPYNWELFFHAPLFIANSLSKNQRFEEARDWYHFIFNPIGVQSKTLGGSLTSKYWITKPFFETTDRQYIQQRIDNILRMLAGDSTVPGYSAQTKKDLEGQVIDWRTNPFEPHRIANYRTVAYQKTVVMKYLDNLISWGDNLFRQDSMESINEATQLYILAAEILGPAPKKMPPIVKPPVASFNELETELDTFANALVQVENLIPVLFSARVDGADQAPLPMLYFCVPHNDKMLGYWDIVADRLYKIRHCMNIEGVVRQLALFEPPIDPAALVKAVAGGVDISSALADLNAPLPLYRFNVLLQKANEVCNDVKALGGALLAGLEKKDAEAMGLLRQGQEIRLLEAVKAVREKQIEEAKENLAGVRKNKELMEIKSKYYASREFMNAGEIVAAVLSSASIASHTAGTIADVLAGVMFLIPDFKTGASGFGGTPHLTVEIPAGDKVGKSTERGANGLYNIATILEKSAGLASTLSSYKRREEEWNFQEDLAIKEAEQIDKAIAAAELRIAIAKKELENHILQIENAKATDEFMRSKYTGQELYQWQIGQISGVFFQSYKLAYDLAKRAERCFRFELGLASSSYINFGYWDSLKKGLLSGEKLQYDLRRLEAAFLEQNRREFELTKHVSLAVLDPLALVKLRETGRCFLRLPEEIFDLDYPGHYFRRIKSVSLTLPCVAGPYTTISCTLRLLKSSIRINTANGEGADRYAHNIDDRSMPTDDDRFVENNIPVKAIAASNGQNDSGVFELSFRDERYLPFEGAGAVSDWSLELFNDAAEDFGKVLRQFDYGTISDAILHVKYTAREDAGPFKSSAIAHLRDHFAEDGAVPSLRMFNLRQEFPTQWHRFLHPTSPATENIFELDMSPKLFPMRDIGKTLKVSSITVLARCADAGSYDVFVTPPLPATPPPPEASVFSLARVNEFGGLHIARRDVSAWAIQIESTSNSARWRIVMSRAGRSLEKDTNDGDMEVKDLLLVLGYDWDYPP